MGLDMTLEGHRFHFHDGETVDGFPLKREILELGYWRKHPDLHGYIVQTFAKGRDECQEIELSPERINDIIQAIKDHRLPHTEGFFFGSSDGSEDEESIAIFERAKAWLEKQEPDAPVWRGVVYRASW